MVVCPSWPQACIFPGFVERCSNVFPSAIGSGSMAARSPTERVPVPARSVPTTPVLPRPRCTVKPKAASFAATRSEVRVSSNPSSGCACRSRLQPVSSACIWAIRSAIGMVRFTPRRGSSRKVFHLRLRKKLLAPLFASLVHLDAGLLDHLGVLRHLGAYMRIQLFRRGAYRVHALGYQLLAHVGCVQIGRAS